MYAGSYSLDSSSEIEKYLDSLLSKRSIFKNRDALRPDFTPDFLPHRENELRRLSEIFAPLLLNSKPSNALLFGKTGTGKTASIKLVSKIMLQKSREKNINFIASYINCRLEGTEYRILSSFANSLNLQVPFTGLATEEVLKRITSYLQKVPANVLLILDEVDTLVKSFGDDILYELSRINETFSNSRLALVVISNDLSFKEFLDPRVLSSLSEEEVLFKPYTAEELKDILNARVELAFYENVISKEVLNLVAAMSASEHGDARRALNLLRVAGEIAERRNSPTITEQDVREASLKIEEDQVFEISRTLPLHSRLLLTALLIFNQNNQVPSSGELFNKYKSLASSLRIQELTYRRVSMLLNELEMLGLIQSKVQNMGRHGRTRKMKLATPLEPIRKALSSDAMLAQFISK
ncbi:MAG: AAA family ATPase [Candidatus Brockarchaeota archaeon]|nr:AAA family ATPase [Candidatus Brockarchaeota archaeon]MBO3768220.1 AAA family ATPase [Candidatus Brockarchaeota archaeon]MBO3800788.1 AAA family ATPase [Candidatus Brockarchaeota archaeon]